MNSCVTCANMLTTVKNCKMKANKVPDIYDWSSGTCAIVRKINESRLKKT